METAAIHPATVHIRETSLLEIGVAELESGTYQRCTLTLRHAETSGMRCAEGVFGEQLVAAYPERYGWLSDGQLLDRHVGLGGAGLYEKDWNVLHPRGYDLACNAAERLGASSVAQANDQGASFADIAEAFRGVLADLAAGTLRNGGCVIRR
jgi:hypothetical protein